MKSIDERKTIYLADVYAEMEKRGISNADAPRIIEKTGFLSALDKYPEEQMHYDVYDAVNEILLVAATS